MVRGQFKNELTCLIYSILTNKACKHRRAATHMPSSQNEAKVEWRLRQTKEPKHMHDRVVRLVMELH